jgi:hypothetical protein
MQGMPVWISKIFASPLHKPGIIILSGLFAIFKCELIHSMVANAATFIGNVLISHSNGNDSVILESKSLSEGLASLPVTNSNLSLDILCLPEESYVWSYFTEKTMCFLI